MKLKGYLEITFDEFPRLYETSRHVIITHLYQAEHQLKCPPKKFCKMYTTQVLADQLCCYLNFRKVPFNEKDFVIVEPFKPFVIQMPNLVKLQVMFCTASKLGNTYVVLLRKGDGQPVLYAYSAVNQTAPEHLIRNQTFNEWGRLGFEEVILNLDLAYLPYTNIDFDKIVQMLNKLPNPVRIKLPIFGYEYAVSEMTYHWRKHIALSEHLKSYYKLLQNVKVSHLAEPQTKTHILLYSEYDTMSINDTYEELTLSFLEWTPIPRRNNLEFLCSLMRPKKISCIDPKYAFSEEVSFLKDFLRP